jgi:hypothetical protein
MRDERNHPVEMARIALSPANVSDGMMLERLIKDAFERLTWLRSADQLDELLAELTDMVNT